MKDFLTSGSWICSNGIFYVLIAWSFAMPVLLYVLFRGLCRRRGRNLFWMLPLPSAALWCGAYRVAIKGFSPVEGLAWEIAEAWSMLRPTGALYLSLAPFAAMTAAVTLVGCAIYRKRG